MPYGQDPLYDTGNTSAQPSQRYQIHGPVGAVDPVTGQQDPILVTPPPLRPADIRQMSVDFWTQKGAPAHVAEGITDAIGGESGFNPTAVNKQSGATGLAQDLGERKTALTSQPGWQDPGVQLQNMWREATGGDKIATQHWQEILKAPTREAAKELWSKYFERPGTGGGYGKDRTVGAPGWNVSPNAIAFEQNRPDTSVVYMTPADYLALTPEQEPNEGRAKRSSLSKSLALGEDIQAIPTLDVNTKGGAAKVFDQDGRNRAVAAQKAGVDLIPVAIHGIPPAQQIGSIQGMRGDKPQPYNFVPVEPHAIAPEPSLNLAARIESPATPLGRILAAAKDQAAMGGGGRLGFSPQTREGLREIGLLPPASVSSPYDPVRLLVEGAGTLGDLANRAGEAVIGGIGGAAGQIYQELGGSQGMGERLGRNISTIGNLLPLLAGAGGFAPEVAARGMAEETPSEAALNAAPAPRYFPPEPYAKPERTARKLISQAVSEGQAAGGPSARDIMDRIAAARAAGKPMTLADIPSKPLERLAGTVYRSGGQAGETMRQFFEKRGKAFTADSSRTEMGARLEGDIAKHVSPDMRGPTRQLLDDQRKAGQPLWDKAMEGGSIAPLQKQFQDAYDQADALARDAEERLAALSPVRVPKQPMRLASYLQRLGGVRDVGGDVRHTLGGARFRPGLINSRGLPLDEAALRAWQEGYLEGNERPSVNDLLDALDADLRGDPVYAAQDRAAAAVYENAIAHNRSIDEAEAAGQSVVSDGDYARKRRQAEHDLAAATADKKSVEKSLAQATADNELGKKGAVWSPRLQRLWGNPLVKRGLNLGMQIERNKADAAGSPVDWSEYAITGVDENDMPIVSKVPNMRLIQMAKQGLDALLFDSEGMRDPFTHRLTKLGQSVDALRRTLLSEADRLNPDWKAARDHWSGETQSMHALEDGQDALKRSERIDDLKEHFDSLSPNDKKFFLVGVADYLRENLRNTRMAGDPSKSLINTPAVLQKLKAILPERDFQNFVDSVGMERQMFETGGRIMGGSQTAEREAADNGIGESAMHGLLGAAHLAHGNPIWALGHFLRARRDISLIPNAGLNQAIARLLTDPNVSPMISSPGVGLLERMPLPKVQNALRSGRLSGGLP